MRNIIAGTNVSLNPITDDNITINMDGYSQANLDGKFTNNRINLLFRKLYRQEHLDYLIHQIIILEQ